MTGMKTFARRQNFDASVDSICTNCYQTIASTDSVTEVGLASAEQNHVCSPHAEFNRPHWDALRQAA
jgi:hypothetical protein